jgi:hypothetical protein
MSYAIDAAARLHHRQVEAATQVQDLFLKAFGGLAKLADKAPQPPARLAAPLEKVAAPVAKFFGTRSELAEYVGQSRRDWSDLRTSFQDAIAERKVAPQVTTVTPIPKSRAKATKPTNA